MLKTKYDAANAHLDIVLGINLEKHLEIWNKKSLKHYAVLGALLVVYRYAEALGQKLIIHDMTSDGHESHLLGTELDFDLVSDRRNPVQQINMASDLIRIRDILRPYFNAFRIGIYFDHFNNTEAKTYEDFKEMYGKKSTGVSMHLGVRYQWQSQDYKGALPPANYDEFSLWGKGKGHYNRKGLWAKRILSWDIGFIKGRSIQVAHTLLNDFILLDRNPPTMIMLGVEPV